MRTHSGDAPPGVQGQAKRSSHKNTDLAADNRRTQPIAGAGPVPGMARVPKRDRSLHQYPSIAPSSKELTVDVEYESQLLKARNYATGQSIHLNKPNEFVLSQDGETTLAKTSMAFAKRSLAAKGSLVTVPHSNVVIHQSNQRPLSKEEEVSFKQKDPIKPTK